jgi:hypothetical protein
MEEDLIIGLDSVTFVGKTIPQVLEFFGVSSSEETGSTPTYQQVFRLGVKIHEHLRKKGRDFCSCKLLHAKYARTACFVLWNFQAITRKGFTVIPTDSLYDDGRYQEEEEEEEKEDGGKGKGKKKKRKRKRGKTSTEKLKADDLLCIMYIREVPGPSVKVTHCPKMYNPSLIAPKNMLRIGYNYDVGREIWERGGFKGNLEEFVGLNVPSLWEEAMVEEALINPDADVGSTGSTISASGSTAGVKDPTSMPSAQVVRDENQQADILEAMGVTPDDQESNQALRDRAIVISWNLQDFVPKLPEMQENDEDAPPMDLFRISEDRSKEMPYSLMFFRTLRKATNYARVNRLPLFAQDVIKGSRAKNYFVPSSWVAAYQWIRLGTCAKECPQMIEQTRMGEGGTGSPIRYHPHYEDGHNHVHEIVGVPERPLQFFVDMDTDFTEAPHLAKKDLSEPSGIGIACDLDALDDLTDAIQCWFTWFIQMVFGRDKANKIRKEDWVVLCATSVKKYKVSRHIRLDGSIHFKSIIDLMMFMDLAKVQMYEDLGRGVDELKAKIRLYPERKELGYLLRMLIFKSEVDPMTKMNTKVASIPIDFQVYRINGSMRGPMCSKIDEPFRFTRFPNRPDIRWSDPPGMAEDMREEFVLFKRAFITYIPEESVALSLPIGEMFTLSPIDVQSINKTERIIMSVPRSVWIGSSSIGDAFHREELRNVMELIDKHNTMREIRTGASSATMRHGNGKRRKHSGGSGGVDRIQKFKRCLGDWVSSTSTVLSSSPKVQAIRDYFKFNGNENSGHYLLPWYDSPSIKTELHIDESYDEKTFLKGEDTSRMRTSDDPLSRHYRRGAMDFYRITVYKTRYCPIKGAEHEGANGKGGEAKCWLRIYRNGTVHCRCFTSGCVDIISKLPSTESGKPRYFYPLANMPERLRRILWTDV